MTESASTSPAPTVVAVLGSCITRDNFNSRFNPTYKRWYSCPLHQNQSSMIAIMSDALDVEWEPTREMSDYDRWNVRTELTRSFLTEVVELQPDYLILDFFGDIHFGCVQLDSGEFLTNNRWKTRHTDFYQSMQSAGRFRTLNIFDDTDEYLELWQDAFDRFVEFARERLPRTKLIVHCGHNTGLLKLPNRPVPVSLQKNRGGASLDVPRSNDLWAQLDKYAVEAAGAEVIDLTATSYPTYEGHPWGPFYVHYTMDYYRQFLAELHRIHLSRTAGPDIAAMVAEMDAARVGRAASDAADCAELVRRLRKRIQRQGERIKDLERVEASRLGSRVARRIRSLRR